MGSEQAESMSVVDLEWKVVGDVLLLDGSDGVSD